MESVRGGQMKLFVPVIAITLYSLTACTMFTAWRSIPAPGGCEECHKVPISANWQVSYKPVILTDERAKEAFHLPESLVTKSERPVTGHEKQKVEQSSCFECHNSPDALHKSRKGSFHH